jgi:hypothetical protein
MNPEKIKTVSLVLLGVWVLLVGALGYMSYDASCARAEAEETLDSENSAFNRFNNAPVFPSKASIESVKSNELAWSIWYDTAFTLAGRGDKDIPTETPPVFKQRLQSTVRRLQSLKGEVSGKLSQPTFYFGFEKFLGEADALPQSSEVPLLESQLDFIEHFAEMMSESGVMEVKALQCLPRNPDDTECARHLDYKVTFASRPAGIVKAVNALAMSSRFIAVSGFSFRETGDAITPRLSSDGKEEEKTGRGGRRGRRGRGVQADEVNKVDDSRKENRVITNPSVNAVFDVSMTVKVYDFRTPPETDDGSKSKKKKRGRR